MSEFVPALETVMLLGAARMDCSGDPVLLAELRGAKDALAEAVSMGDYDEAQRIIRSVMGAGWEPSPEWVLSQ